MVLPWITSGPTATIIISDCLNIDDRMKFLILWDYTLSYHVSHRLSVLLMLRELFPRLTPKNFAYKRSLSILLTSVGISFGLYIFVELNKHTVQAT